MSRLWWHDSAASYLRPALAVMAFAGLMLSAFLVVGPALAGPAGAPGVNATVKIHDDEPEPNPEIQNQPHVCTFHVHGFFFDEAETGVWWIQGWPPTGGPPEADPANAVMGPEPYTATEDDGHGAFEWRTTERTLPDGHYKLFVEQTHNGVVTYKHKVFWVDCEEATPTPSPTPTETLSPTPSPTPTMTASATPTSTGSVGGETMSPSPTPTMTASATPTPTGSVGEGTMTPSPTPTQTATMTATASPTPEGSVAEGTGTPSEEQSVQGATGTPAGEIPNTATSPPGSGGLPLTAAFLVVLTGSLGVLAYANVAAAKKRRG